MKEGELKGKLEDIQWMLEVKFGAVPSESLCDGIYRANDFEQVRKLL